MKPVWITDTLTRDLSRAVHYTLLWGLEGVVLRTVGQGERVPEVNEPKVRHRLATEEVPLVAIDPGLFEGDPGDRPVWMNDLARLADAVAFCRRMNCRTIICGALPGGATERAAEILRRAGEQVASGGCRLLVRNEGEERASGEHLADLLLHVAHPAVGACWDPAGAIAAGGDAPAGQHALGPHIGMLAVRAKDFEARPAAVPWDDLLAALAASGFDGPVCLDMSAIAAKKGLRVATDLIHALRAARTLRG